MTIGVAVIGMGWMGRVHTQSYLRVRHHYPDLPQPVLISVADGVPGRAEAAAAQFGFGESTLDWRTLVDDPRVAAVSVTAPNFLHREMGVAFAAAGKHLWIEKPVGLAADDARAITGPGQVTVGFNYRHAPAVAKAHALLTAGAIGEVTHARFSFCSDYAASPDDALTWRFERERGGNGVLGDLGSHAVDLIRHLLGEITEVRADTAILIPERRRPLGVTSGHERGTGELGTVENEDWFGAQFRMASQARVSCEASRVAVDSPNAYGFTIYGRTGSLSWDFRRMGELRVRDATIFAGPGDGDFGAFQPGAAIAMSYDDLKVIEASLFLRSIVDDVPHGPTLTDAIRAAEVLDAIAISASTGRNRLVL
ncbi:putative dehydrogenase [Actinoplanes lutulentus]|uniref:Putative dehydrogenase n=1 Tax=Actinoplanes lutulentus TaxID=1287878 RepID=A0A327ZHJ9_9ACTN|nr:Gfo/Idh/MocA family oxidoreductase [Actinoplanes lutulentus]MBB2945232.1 putative dehydrogenase [Actinoplanes lutulentus]RAK40632.1 putative dehydrogenase [Actinoplanes lutulentus]